MVIQCLQHQRHVALINTNTTYTTCSAADDRQPWPCCSHLLLLC
jgi:hypothetical protein